MTLGLSRLGGTIVPDELEERVKLLLATSAVACPAGTLGVILLGLELRLLCRHPPSPACLEAMARTT
jgi:hypothetical protein